ncbi:hypothetical protein PV10_08431 [Exophiala mesophila]|uniref:Uncharacterized protein n=1 Tax=Exophiala mesophila TaxID=212818 RepID=A0A0D1Z1Z2_EXOME|nr:uncharacterized protein PV10_08431 [Exophiala mesophila]KIV88787.1 hypothetical protein PV10_08431 [Exophiala mesophila]
MPSIYPSWISVGLGWYFVCLILLRGVWGQTIEFQNIPPTVQEDTEIVILWSGGDGVTPIYVDLIQDGRVIDDVVDDDEPEGNVVQSFEWDVDLENNPGGYYTLRLVQGTQTVDSTPINIVDELGRSATDPLPTSTAPASGTTSAAASTSDSASASPSASGTSAPPTGEPSNTAAATAAAESGTPPEGSNLDNDAVAGDGGGLSGGAIAGIVIGVLVIVALVGLLVWFLRRRAQRRRIRARSTEPGSGLNDEKDHRGDGDGTFLTAAPFAAAAVGAAHHGKGGIEPDLATSELDGGKKPSQNRQGVYELHAPDTARSPASHELHSPDASTLTNSGTGGTGTMSDVSRTEAGESSVGELIGSPVTSAVSPAADSPQDTQRGAITRKEVGSTGPNSSTRPSVYELD